MTPLPTVAEALVGALKARGLRRIFGVPGGGSSLDIIAATEAQGIDFVLTQTETAAAIMAAVTAELSGAPGAVITTVGPGAASAVNGVAYAALERAPLLLITDCVDTAASLHQAFDQGALFAPLAKATWTLRAEDAAASIEAALDTAMAPPPGPVHIELGAGQAAARLTTPPSPRSAPPRHDEPSDGEVAAARALLAACRRPVVVAGLHARDGAAAAAVRRLVDGLDCPVLVTYKAKGVVADRDPRLVGAFTGGTAEADCLGRADVILFYGVDPLEPISRAWPYRAPLLELATVAGAPHPVTPAAALIGALDRSAERLRGANAGSDWEASEIAGLRDAMRARLTASGAGVGDGHDPRAVVEAAQRAAPARCRATVDSGAHMFPAMGLWRAERPNDVLKSCGLSTMAFALPAAIAAALQEPARPVIAFTGDAGLMMCLSELATAVRLEARIVVIVFNDAALSLIDIKQQKQGRASRGVRYPSVDLAAAARALGCQGWRVEADMALAPVLEQACAADGPALVDVVIDPSGYAAQLAALRD